MSGSGVGAYRVRAKSGQLEAFSGLLPENQDRNLAVAVSYVPYSLDSGSSNAYQRGGRLIAAFPGTDAAVFSHLLSANTEKLVNYARNVRSTAH